MDALLACVTDDHCFIDTQGNRIEGREAIERAWRGFFDAFPDYRNEFSALYRRGDSVVVFGRSHCSAPGLDGPALWTAVVREGLVAEWRVYEETAEMRRALKM